MKILSNHYLIYSIGFDTNLHSKMVCKFFNHLQRIAIYLTCLIRELNEKFIYTATWCKCVVALSVIEYHISFMHFLGIEK